MDDKDYQANIAAINNYSDALTIFISDSYIVQYDFSFVIFGILLAALVVFNHRTNIKRLKNGTENKLSFKK